MIGTLLATEETGCSFHIKPLFACFFFSSFSRKSFNRPYYGAKKKKKKPVEKKKLVKRIEALSVNTKKGRTCDSSQIGTVEFFRFLKTKHNKTVALKIRIF